MYISYNTHLYPAVNHPVRAYRQRVGRSTFDFSPNPLKVTRDLPLAPTTRFSANSLDLSDLDQTTEPANIDSLSIGPNADLPSLAHPYFRNIRALSLTNSFKMDIGAQTAHTLPNLVCIVLTIKYDPSETIPLFTWNFPRLAMFALTPLGTNSVPSSGLLEFLHAHSSTLEEIDLTEVDSKHFTINADWACFSRLKSICLPNPIFFTDALPLIQRRWTLSVTGSELSIQHIRPLVIIVNASAGASISNDMITQLQQYRDVFAHFTLRMRHDWNSWVDAVESVFEEVRLEGGKDEFLASLRLYWPMTVSFFRMIEETHLPLVDCNGDPASCDAAKAVRALAVKYGL